MSTQPVTESDKSHPAVPVKLSDAEQQRVQQANAKLQAYIEQNESKVLSHVMDFVLAALLHAHSRH